MSRCKAGPGEAESAIARALGFGPAGGDRLGPRGDARLIQLADDHERRRPHVGELPDRRRLELGGLDLRALP